MKSFLKSRTALMAFDQLVVSGGNFLTTVICARLLTTTDFGMFSAAWLGILFLSSVVMAVIVFPMMTAFPGMKIKAANRFVDGNISVYFAGSGLLTVIGLSGAMCFLLESKVEIALVVIAGVAAAIAVHLQELLRRILILRGETSRLLASTICTYAGRLLLLFGLFQMLGLRSVAAALWILAGTAVIGAMVAFPKGARPSISRAKYSWNHNGGSAKWLLPAGLMQWTTVNSFLIAASFLSPISVLAQLRAAQNVATLSNPVVQLLENIIPVTATRQFAEGGEMKLRRYIGKIVLLASLPAVCFTPVIFLFGDKLLKLIYGSQYADLAPVLGMMWLLQLMVILTVPIRSALRSLGKTRAWFSAYLASTIVSVPAAVMLSSRTATLISAGMVVSNVLVIAIASATLFMPGKFLLRESANV